MSRQDQFRQAKEMAEAAGYDLWETGGGCDAFGKTLRELVEGEFGSHLEVLITTDDGTDVVADPADPVWMVGVTFQNNYGGETVESTRNLTLAQAIETGRAYEARAEELWDEHYRGPGLAP